MFYTSRLMLRGYDARCDSNLWLQWLNDEATARAIFGQAFRPSSTDDVKGIIERITKSDQPPCFAICLKPEADSEHHPANLTPEQDLYVLADGKTARYPMIGTLTIRAPHARVSYTSRVVDMGIGFAKESQGKGYGTEVLEWVCGYAFDVLGLHRIQLQTEAENLPARKCYKKVGFTEEGTMRKALFLYAEWKDEIVLGILAEEWRERKGRKAVAR